MMPMSNPKSAEIPAAASGFDQLGADNLGVVLSTETKNASSSSDEMTLFNNAYREYSNKRLDLALNGFQEFVKAYPNHAFADDALYWRGECYLAEGKFLYAIGELERLTRRYPASDKAPSALFRIGFAYDKLRDYGKAAEYYFEVVDKFPGTDAARRASSRMAELKNSASAGGPLVSTSGTR
jgi:tol-pal system protein YbgF